MINHGGHSEQREASLKRDGEIPVFFAAFAVPAVVKESVRYD
jgi:hypothetical protein